MKNMTLDKIALAVAGKLVYPQGYEDIDREATGFVIDNRLVKKDYIFIPIKGQKVDGHKFIPQAFNDGAMAVFSEEDIDITDGPYILVESTEQALKDLATYYRMTLDIPVIGVIGSVGKTSTKEMISSVLTQKYKVLKTAGNLNNEIGLPLTLLSIKEEHDIAVVEMGISEFGEMDRLGAMAKPDAIAFTNVGPCHLENLGDLDGVLKAKSEVFPHMAKNSIVVINNDDAKLSTVSNSDFDSSKNVSIIKVGLVSEDCDYKASCIESLGADGMKAIVESKAKDFDQDIEIPLQGNHNISNALTAIAMAKHFGLTDIEILRGLATAGTISGRSNFIKTKDLVIIDDCYNANPMSMKASLAVLGLQQTRKVALLGDMGELGKDEASLHESLAPEIVDNDIDVLVTVGPLSLGLAKKVGQLSDSIEIKSYENVDQCLENIDGIVKPNDTVLVKASHFMGFTKIVEYFTK